MSNEQSQSVKSKIKDKKSYILHKDSLDIIPSLDTQELAEFTRCLYHYLNFQELPEDISKVVKISFLPIANQFARDAEKSKTGKNHWNWKGGITPESRTIRNSVRVKNWRHLVFQRDSYTCQNCGEMGGQLNAHHIKHFATHPELRHELSNGITLCKNCHIKEHKNARQ